MTILVEPASAALARRQAAWIVTLEPWLSLGYQQKTLARWLGRQGDADLVRVLRVRPGGPPQGIVVFQKDVLLGWFVPLLAVRPESAGQGFGRALLNEVARLGFASRRWLYVSCDAQNEAALRFYRRMKFSRVGRLPDMVRLGREEWLLRVGRETWAQSSARPQTPPRRSRNRGRVGPP